MEYRLILQRIADDTPAEYAGLYNLDDDELASLENVNEHGELDARASAVVTWLLEAVEDDRAPDDD